MVVAVQANKQIEQQLGRTGLAELSAHLWAQDCQTCGRPLAGQRPALVVEDSAVTASASLHHRGCRRPEWSDDERVVSSGMPLLTHVTYAMLAPFEPVDSYVRLGSGSLRGWVLPMLLVNPGLEQVPLRRVGHGEGWAVSTVEIFSRHGLDTAGPGLAMREPQRPIARIRGRLIGDDLAVGIGPHRWSAPLGREVSDQARGRGGVLLAVTTRVHPGEHRDVSAVVDAMLAAAAGGQVAVGWLFVDGASSSADVPSSERLERMLRNPSAGP